MANQDTDLRCYLTNAGIAAENNSIQLGRKLPVKEMVFGSGLLADGSDPRLQTTMIQEEYAVPCGMLFDPESPTLLVFKSDLPADVGGFHIHEVAIRLEDGTLYGYARGKGDYKPTIEQGATDSVRYAVEMYTTNASNVECKIDLSKVYVDWEDLEARIKAHKSEPDPHSQYTKLEHLVGLIGEFHDSGVKAGWVDLRGGELSRETDKILWEYALNCDMVISQTLKDSDPMTYAMYFGNGYGQPTFTLPNHHLGHFVRGAPSDVNHGDTQDDQNKAHSHVLSQNFDIISNKSSTQTTGNWYGFHPDGNVSGAIGGSGGDESRPLTANLSIKIHRGWM